MGRSPQGGEIGRALLERMGQAIAHRGPDGTGCFEDGQAFLVHRRLSIIDVAGGHQPMTNETGQAWIVYNGEIFNHADVRPQLDAAGHRYRTRCDTETILHAWEEYGADCVQKFRGMFAFAIWNKQNQTLFCARDRMGIKPFYYFWDGKTFVFGSEIKALLEHPAVPVKLEKQILGEYLAFGYGSGEQTLFAGIRKLPPGHILEFGVNDAEPRITRYWDVPAAVAVDRPESEWIADLRGRLEETIRMRLMSDVPLGMFLSGGVDSSAIAAFMRQMVSTPVQSFSVGYDEEVYSELGYARQVSEAIGTEHHEVRIGMRDFFDALPRLIWHEDEPICWPSSISLYYVSRLAAKTVKVVLTGEGSDELFAGYERYGHYMFNTRWKRFAPAPLHRMTQQWIGATSLLNGNLRRKLMHTFLGREDTLESLHLDNFYCAFPAEERLRLAGSLPGDPYASYRGYWNSRSGSVLDRMLYADQKTYLAELLMKQDQMSMACSIESRVPLLDHTLVEFATTIPDHLKLRGRTGKYIFKKAVEGLLPESIIYRKKMGFPTPIKDWLRDKRSAPLYAILRDRNGLLDEIIDPAGLSALIEGHQQGRIDATDRIWRLLNIQLWGAIFLQGRRNEYWDGLLTTAAVKT